MAEGKWCDGVDEMMCNWLCSDCCRSMEVSKTLIETIGKQNEAEVGIISN